LVDILEQTKDFLSMHIGQSFFSGERPRLAEHIIRDQEAQLAKNCDLSRGDLRPFRAHAKIQNLTETGELQSLYNWKTNGGNFWIANAKELQFARSPIPAELHSRVYFTGPGLSEPRVLTTSIQSNPFDIDTDYYKLGLPAPLLAPTIGGAYVVGTAYRAYLYTYVVKLGATYAEEGINSPISNISDYGSGNVDLSLFSEPPTQRSIGAIRIYRTSSSSSGASEFRYVGEFDTDGVDFTTKTFTDNVAEADLGEVLSTSTFTPPPTALKGLIALKNGSLVGYAGRRVYFSEPYLPHAWPYSYAIDANIVGLGLIGSTVVVLTDEYPYLMDGQPDAIITTKLISSQSPCVSSRGIISCELGVLFPSDDGISLVTYDGVTLFSYEYLNKDQYNLNYSPTSIRAEYYDGKYFAYHGGGGFIIDIREKTLSGLTDPLLSSALHYSIVDSKLYFIAFGDDSNPNALYQFQGNSKDSYLEYTYRSKRYLFASELNFSSCKVVVAPEANNNDANIAANAAIFSGSLGGGAVNEFVVNDGGAVPNYDAIVKTYSATFNFYGDDVLLFTRSITGTVTFRLPADVLYKRCYYELIGDIPIVMVVIADSMDELNNV
jgi:hypothetical protein